MYCIAVNANEATMYNYYNVICTYDITNQIGCLTECVRGIFQNITCTCH